MYKKNCGCKTTQGCIHYNLLLLYPDLCKDWDYQKNKILNIKLPEEFSPKSVKEVWWICNKNPCGCHLWKATIRNRAGTLTTKATGCPYCANLKLCEHNNLLALHPELCNEWDYIANERNPNSYARGSKNKVWWICNKNPCGCHKWQASICHRTKINPSNCPYCDGKNLCSHNNLSALHPEICKEWDYNKNLNSPETYPPGSDESVWWVCNNDPNLTHSWEAIINHRTSKRKYGCPDCRFKSEIKLYNILIQINPNISKHN